MTQAKKTKKVVKTPSLAERFRALTPEEQTAITYFFNAHNLAHYVYDTLSINAKEYVTYCIRLSQQADKIENENSAQD